MMLIDIDSGKTIESMPYEKEFSSLRARLTEDEFDGMVSRINELIDSGGGEVTTGGWLPGTDWSGTPFQPIYTKAVCRDDGRSARFFGQLVWYTIMHRRERWGSGRYETRGRDIASRTYFVLKD